MQCSQAIESNDSESEPHSSARDAASMRPVLSKSAAVVSTESAMLSRPVSRTLKVMKLRTPRRAPSHRTAETAQQRAHPPASWWRGASATGFAAASDVRPVMAKGSVARHPVALACFQAASTGEPLHQPARGRTTMERILARRTVSSSVAHLSSARSGVAADPAERAFERVGAPARRGRGRGG